jgi:hypothetical protein
MRTRRSLFQVSLNSCFSRLVGLSYHSYRDDAEIRAELHSVAWLDARFSEDARRNDQRAFFFRVTIIARSLATNVARAPGSSHIISSKIRRIYPNEMRILSCVEVHVFLPSIPQPPPTNHTISTLAPSPTTADSQSTFRTIERFNSTATRAASISKNASSPVTFKPSGTRFALPFTTTSIVLVVGGNMKRD